MREEEDEESRAERGGDSDTTDTESGMDAAQRQAERQSSAPTTAAESPLGPAGPL